MTAATGWGWEGVGWERATAETAAGMETVATAAMAAVRLRGRRVRGGLEGCCLSEQGFVGSRDARQHEAAAAHQGQPLPVALMGKVMWSSRR